MSAIQEFKDKYKRFYEAMQYIVNQHIDPEKEPEHWAKLTKNFYERFEKPLDACWDALPEALKDQVAHLYLKEKAKQDAIVQKAIKVFDAKIVKVSKDGKN